MVATTAAAVHTATGAAAAAAPNSYHPTSPARILDTRVGLGAPAGRLGPGRALDLQVAGRGGVPATGATAVVLNVTVTDTTASSYLTVYPTGGQRPLASNLNWQPGEARPNLVEVAVGGGQVTVFNFAGSTSVVADVEGWYSDVGQPAGSGLYRGVVPSRVLDTRSSLGGHAGPVVQGETMRLVIAGKNGVPATGAGAAALNVTATGANLSSFVTIFPAGTPRPIASNLNFVAGETIPNRVVVAIGAGGAIAIYNNTGSAHIVVDVDGWFTDASDATAAGGTFTAVTPSRLLDTRNGTGGAAGKLGQNQTLTLQVAGSGEVPATGAGAVVLNVTAVDGAIPSYLTIFPEGGVRTLSSDLNFSNGDAVPNLVVATLSGSGKIDIYNRFGTVDVVVDVMGWLSTSPLTGVAPSAPQAVQATAGELSATVAWTAPTNPGSGAVTGYTVVAAPGGSTAVAGGDEISAVVPDLTAGVSYTFVVYATNWAGWSPASAPSPAVVPVAPPPPATNVIGDVPWIHQQFSLSCEAAALQMALAHEHIYPNQQQELNDMGIDWRAAYWDASGLRWGDPYVNFVGSPYGSEIYYTGYGVYFPPVARIATAYGGSVLRASEGVAPQDVYSAVLAGHPVITWITYDWKFHPNHPYLAFDGRWVLFAGTAEHAATIVGVSPTSVLVNDPDRSQYWMDKATFEASYATYNRMAVVLN